MVIWPDFSMEKFYRERETKKNKRKNERLQTKPKSKDSIVMYVEHVSKANYEVVQMLQLEMNGF